MAHYVLHGDYVKLLNRKPAEGVAQIVKLIHRRIVLPTAFVLAEGL